MTELHLNSPALVGEYIKKIGVEQIRFIPSNVFNNDQKVLNVYITYELFSKLAAEVEPLLRYKNENPQSQGKTKSKTP